MTSARTAPKSPKEFARHIVSVVLRDHCGLTQCTLETEELLERILERAMGSMMEERGMLKHLNAICLKYGIAPGSPILTNDAERAMEQVVAQRDRYRTALEAADAIYTHAGPQDPLTAFHMARLAYKALYPDPCITQTPKQ